MDKRQAIRFDKAFPVSISPEVFRERVMAWCEPLRPTVVADTPDRLEVKTGSQS